MLVNEGADLTIATLDNLKLHNHAQYFRADLRDIANARLAIKEKEYVFHLAGVKGSPKVTTEQGKLMSEIILAVGESIIKACAEAEIQNVLFTSSIGAYAEADLLTEENAYKGKAMDTPGEAKRKVERLIQSYGRQGLAYKIVRLANVYGQGDNFDPETGMFIPSLMAKVLRGDDPVEIWGDGSQVRDFIYSKDVARGIIHMMVQSPDSQPVNIGSGIGYTVAEVVETLNEIVDFEFRYDMSKPSGVAMRVLDVSKAKALGFESQYSLVDGLRETWDWFKANPKQYLQRKNYFAEFVVETK